ncbi:MAG: tetratricopeptide repeat protein, partial [Bdellovibrionales bacterium]|nr:tetratricopeptide repeat protein [Bdellovibrionales bacterium]
STEAGIKHEAGDFEGAIAMLERGIQMQRDNPLPTPIYTQKLADKLFFRADIHLEQDEPGKAIPLYEEGIALARPILERSKLHLFPALENLAYACIRTGQYELALSP